MDTRKTSSPTSSDHASNTVRRPGIDLYVTSLEEIYRYEPPRYIIEPILADGWSHLLTAPAGDCKSILSSSVCKSVVTGEPLFGKYPVNSTGAVLIVDEENPGSLLRDRVEKFGLDKDLPLYFLHLQEVRIDDNQCLDSLMSTIEMVNPILVVIDPLIRVHRQDENSSTSMRLVMGNIRKIAKTGRTVWIVHHQGHESKRSRGSSDIIAGVDIEYSLSKEKNILILKSGKSRVEKFGPVNLNFVVTGGTIDIVHPEAEGGPIIREVVKILEPQSWKAVNEIYQELKERQIKVGINKLRDLLKASDGRELVSDEIKTGKTKLLVYSVNYEDQLSAAQERRGVSLKPSLQVDG